jgi:hypothetical protein
MNRRFPPTWTLEEANNACFIVKDANGFVVSYRDSTPSRKCIPFSQPFSDVA